MLMVVLLKEVAVESTKVTKSEARTQRRAGYRASLVWHAITYVVFNAFFWTLDFADGAGPDALAEFLHRVKGPALVTHLSDDARLASDLRHFAAFVHRVCERLLAVHMLSQLHRWDRNRGVGVIGCADHHGIEILAIVEQAAEIVVSFRVRQLAVHPPLFIGIANRHDVRSGADCIAGVESTL